jgi:hypothetical protein
MELKKLSPLDEDLLIDLGYIKDVDYVIAEFDFDIITVAMIPKLEKEDYHDVYVTGNHELYACYPKVINGYFYNKQLGKLYWINKIQYLRIHSKDQKQLPPCDKYSIGEEVSVNICCTSNPEVHLIKNYEYDTINYSGGFCNVRLAEQKDNVVYPVVKYKDYFYIPSKLVSRGLYVDPCKGEDVLYSYDRVEYAKMFKKNKTSANASSSCQPLKIVFLNYNSKSTYMNIRSSHRTSNGFKYSCYDDSAVIGPFINTSDLSFEEKDKEIIRDIISSKRKYEVTWEDDDCWAESFNGARSRDSVSNIGDLGICPILNELFSSKYRVLFKPTPENEKGNSFDFEEILK